MYRPQERRRGSPAIRYVCAVCTRLHSQSDQTGTLDTPVCDTAHPALEVVKNKLYTKQRYILTLPKSPLELEFQVEHQTQVGIPS